MLTTNITGARSKFPAVVARILSATIAKSTAWAVLSAILLCGGLVVQPVAQGFTPLHQAVSERNLEQVESLLGEGADIDAQIENGMTPLYLAASKGYLEIAKVLVDNGADVNLTNKYGWTPMHTATFNNYLTVMDALFDGGADIDVQNDNGATPLLIATQNYHKTAIFILLLKGANTNLADRAGAPLHYAIRNGELGTVEDLIRHGADVNLEGSEGRTPLMLAESLNRFYIAETLKRAGAKK